MNGIIDFLKNNRALRDFFASYGDQMKRMGVILLIGLVFMAGYALFQGKEDAEVRVSDQTAAEDAELSALGTAEDAGGGTPLDGTIFVDIGGAVKTPMLAELPDGSRVDDAIKAAGGLKKEADMTGVNRAEFLVDGQKVFIPSFALDEDGNIIESAGTSDPAAASEAQTGTQDGKVNINTADSDQLQTLSGVGPATAQKIIDYRDSSGRFSAIEDLKNVSGIGDKTFEKLRDHITV